MRNVFAIALAILLALPAGAVAQTTGRANASLSVEEPQARVDQLFVELKRARSEQAAERLANRIRQEWMRSGSASIDLLMRWSQKAIEDKKNDAAMDFLDQVVTLAPDYAEGWNRRATLHFAMDNYAKSMADIGRTLQLEPRHFGALGGMATILKNSGRKEAAMHAYERVLDVYPMMRSAQTELGTLADELAGEGI
ncbi:hypothetical protein FY036_04465 [Mesorhizobium microcysteis]|uniref:Uncharacterized protein n=1 Tax=Neoaquamicrobium microcysteis TaxID=2682781 RepID=A0A5D4H2Y2_9HYPH|nr:hypothetical protein [Mesorhizobium microcysteis]TYR34613.1 hypothetical protein FY036_04465 [Mesorhizobium microcysteis]